MLLGLAGFGVAILIMAGVSTLPTGTSDQRQIAAIYAQYGNRMPPTAMFASRVFTGDPDEPAVDCASILGPRTMVALVFGQSNAANTVEPGYAATQPVFAFHDGQCRKIHDSVPGASDVMGSSWSRLGDRLIAAGRYDKALFIDIARGGASMLNWGPKGDLHALLLGTLDKLREQDITPTHVLFHQGEADCSIDVPADIYKVLLETVIGEVRSRLGENVDIYISRTSLHQDFGCPDRQNPDCYKSCPAIVAAQTGLADPARRIFSGPNTDQLVPWFDRRDGYHFTAQGADRFAAAWIPLLAHDEMPPQSLK